MKQASAPKPPPSRLKMTPSKRSAREINAPTNLTNIASEIHKALTTEQRLSILHHVHQLVDADPSIAHNLLEAGIWDGVILQLKYTLNKHGTSAQEVEALCSLLDRVLCLTSPGSQLSTPLNGNTYELLLKSSTYSCAAASSVLSLWHIASATEECTRQLLWNRRILLWITDILRQSAQEPTVFLADTLGILKNMTYYAHDSFDCLANLPSFLGSIFAVCSFVGHGKKNRERLSAIWRNFAVVQENRTNLARTPGVLNALHALVGQQIANDEGYTTRNVLNTIISLSMDSESCLILLMHGDGVFSNLLHGLLSHRDDTVRKRAARIVRLWASHETSGALLVHCPALMDRVSVVALRDTCQQVKQEAAEAFGRCAGWVQSPMPQQVGVLDALESLCGSSSPNVIARALKGQAAHPNNRQLLIERPIFLNTLISIAIEPTNSSMAREDACCAIADLTAEKKNRLRMATPELLKALCENATSPTRREYAVQALVSLAQEDANIPKMVNFPNLLTNLIQYVSTAETAVKGPVKHAILLLVTEI